MKKYCIFCGKKPVSKTREHVIPHWLIKYTGDPNRIVPMSFDWITGKLREFSFKELKFPACDSCNSKFSKLETQAKAVIISLLDEQSLSSDSFSILLSWFDKVRVGLWLGFSLFNKNRFGIVPHYYIERRVDATDRMLLIYKAGDTREGITFWPVDTPFFYFCPTCFFLRINQFYFINISANFLFSRRLGLPYPKEKWLTNRKGETVVCDVAEGKGRILLPLIKAYYDKACTEIYQPIINPEFIKFIGNHNNYLEELYNTNYVRKYFDDFSFPLRKVLIGKVLMNYKDNIVDYSKVSEKQWIPKEIHERSALNKLVLKITVYIQNYLWDEQTPSFDRLDLKDKQSLKRWSAIVKRANKIILEKIEKELWVL